ncbi:wiskott-Aldrich syndrome protein homolog 1-like [Dermochelys coriacea]|uniref:wiskott-Aldrich syndrome protein homolog 1-like n=1 Tax=Dermochelys coriacea TaxID=27794 RepID=UPI0018E6F40E|nr:wiskott-Aldrich syndrome protein homolog 1-like [Dermochelys coriacea]
MTLPHNPPPAYIARKFYGNLPCPDPTRAAPRPGRPAPRSPARYLSAAGLAVPSEPPLPLGSRPQDIPERAGDPDRPLHPTPPAPAAASRTLTALGGGAPGGPSSGRARTPPPPPSAGGRAQATPLPPSARSQPTAARPRPLRSERTTAADGGGEPVAKRARLPSHPALALGRHARETPPGGSRGCRTLGGGEASGWRPHGPARERCLQPGRPA